MKSQNHARKPGDHNDGPLGVFLGFRKDKGGVIFDSGEIRAQEKKDEKMIIEAIERLIKKPCWSWVSSKLFRSKN